ncbi:MAG: phosphatidylglycerophosphatase A [Candidatus Acidiferrales bacterium]|jgi:phosphatidylglycerophosphatase A
MTGKTDAPTTPPQGSTAANSHSSRKPRFALFVATAAGLGYAPKAPGTFGALAGIAMAMAPQWMLIFGLTPALAFRKLSSETVAFTWPFTNVDPMFAAQVALTTVLALVGVWAAARAATYWGLKDPQRVVIDEVSGQHLALLVGGTLPTLTHVVQKSPGLTLAMLGANAPLGWKYLLLGFILFRLFDIWKPFPARQAESLPGGWGIMADDWIAGLYAAIGLWLARSAGL